MDLKFVILIREQVEYGWLGYSVDQKASKLKR